MEQLQAYPWPGNVRELENFIERAMIGAAGPVLTVDPHWLTMPVRGAAGSPQTLADVERQTIADALRRCRGRIYGPGGAAAALRLKPTTLYGKMRRLGIEKNSS
jgi:formate hydrogenlyase transcriptional activator